MGDYEETDISYVRGIIEGFLLGEWRRTDEDTAFDSDRWEGLYGSRIVYDSVPSYPSQEARRKGEGVVVLADWEDVTETKYLKQGVSLPDDRPGTIVFEDGTVVKTIAGSPVMFTLDERATKLVERWDRTLLEIVRDAYGYYERNRA